MKNNFHRLKVSFHRIHRIDRNSYNFYSISPQILHLLAIYIGNTSTRAPPYPSTPNAAQQVPQTRSPSYPQ